uniref:Uncharacterized protein n=1 Tax=Arundo donax TaxID=35708 RepID=A0A0A9H4Q4_ARUDO
MQVYHLLSTAKLATHQSSVADTRITVTDRR